MEGLNEKLINKDNEIKDNGISEMDDIFEKFQINIKMNLINIF